MAAAVAVAGAAAVAAVAAAAVAVVVLPPAAAGPQDSLPQTLLRPAHHQLPRADHRHQAQQLQVAQAHVQFGIFD